VPSTSVCVCVCVLVDEAAADGRRLTSSAINCSVVDSWTGERVTSLSLHCHRHHDVIAVTSLCAGFTRSRDCGTGSTCCPDELHDCRVAVLSTHPTFMSLSVSCDGQRSCNVQIYQPRVTYCVTSPPPTTSDVIRADYVIVLYRCTSSAGQQMPATSSMLHSRLTQLIPRM